MILPISVLLVQGRLLLSGRLLKSQYELLPFDALCNLIAKMHNTSKFGKLDLWKRISFIILSMIDLYKDNHVRAFVNVSLKKLFLRNY